MSGSDHERWELAEARARGEVDDARWAVAVAAHGPALERELAEIDAQRTAVAALARPGLPSELRASLRGIPAGAAAGGSAPPPPTTSAPPEAQAGGAVIRGPWRWRALVPALLAAGLALAVVPTLFDHDRRADLASESASPRPSTAAGEDDEADAEAELMADAAPAESRGERYDFGRSNVAPAAAAPSDRAARGRATAADLPADEEHESSALADGAHVDDAQAQRPDRHSRLAATNQQPSPAATREPAPAAPTAARAESAPSGRGELSIEVAEANAEDADASGGMRWHEPKTSERARLRREEAELAEQASDDLADRTLTGTGASAPSQDGRREQLAPAADDQAYQDLLTEARDYAGRQGVDGFQEPEATVVAEALAVEGRAVVFADLALIPADADAAADGVRVSLALSLARARPEPVISLALTNLGDRALPLRPGQFVLEGLDDDGAARWETVLPQPADLVLGRASSIAWEVALLDELAPPPPVVRLRLQGSDPGAVLELE